jgi:hypothetical protein
MDTFSRFMQVRNPKLEDFSDSKWSKLSRDRTKDVRDSCAIAAKLLI